MATARYHDERDAGIRVTPSLHVELVRLREAIAAHRRAILAAAGDTHGLPAPADEQLWATVGLPGVDEEDGE